MIEVELRESVIEYYIKLETTHTVWRKLIKRVAKAIPIIENSWEEFENGRGYEYDNIDFWKIDGLEDDRLYQTLLKMEFEISYILGGCRRMRILVKDLKVEFDRVDKARKAMEKEDRRNHHRYLDWTHILPRMDLLLQWSTQCTNYFHGDGKNLLDRIQAIKNVDYKNEESTHEWIKSIEKLIKASDKVDMILNLVRCYIRPPNYEEDAFSILYRSYN